MYAIRTNELDNFEIISDAENIHMYTAVSLGQFAIDRNFRGQGISSWIIQRITVLIITLEKKIAYRCIAN